MGCLGSKEEEVREERERVAVAGPSGNKTLAGLARPTSSAASPIKPKERRADRDGGAGQGAGEAYELGKTPSDAAQREADSFQELIVRTQRNLIDMTHGAVGIVDAQDTLERQRDVQKFLEEQECPVVSSGSLVPLGVADLDPTIVLQTACVTVEEEDALRMASSAVARALTSTCVVLSVGTIVEQLPEITA